MSFTKIAIALLGLAAISAVFAQNSRDYTFSTFPKLIVGQSPNYGFNSNNFLGQLLSYESNTMQYPQGSMLFFRRSNANSGTIAAHAILAGLIEYVPVNASAPYFTAGDAMLNSYSFNDTIARWTDFEWTTKTSGSNQVHVASTRTADNKVKIDFFFSANSTSNPNLAAQYLNNDTMLRADTLTMVISIANYTYATNQSRLALQILLGSAVARSHAQNITGENATALAGEIKFGDDTTSERGVFRYPLRAIYGANWNNVHVTQMNKHANATGSLIGYPVEGDFTFSDIYLSFHSSQSNNIQWTSALGVADAGAISDFTAGAAAQGASMISMILAVVIAALLMQWA